MNEFPAPILLHVFLHTSHEYQSLQQVESTNTKVDCVVSRDLQRGRISTRHEEIENERAYVSRYATVDNHGDHRTEENNDHKRVDQAEPVNARVEDMEIVIPSSSLSRQI